MAHALRGIGISIDIFEQSPAPRSTGYQLNVHANGKYALAQIGLSDALGNSGDGADVSSAPLIDGLTGTVVRRLAFNGTGHYSSTSFYRGDLHRALLQALEGARPECGREIESVSDDPRRGKVTVSFAGGEVRQFDFVIAEDAMVLARELVTDSVMGERASMSIEMAFERYSAERQPHVARIQTLARRSARGLISRRLFGHRVNNVVTRWFPPRILNRFHDHLLKYAIARVT